jgi:hypothetical protein
LMIMFIVRSVKVGHADLHTLLNGIHNMSHE